MAFSKSLKNKKKFLIKKQAMDLRGPWSVGFKAIGARYSQIYPQLL
jgi:hypothetical protein